MQIIERDISELIPYINNAKKHPTTQVDQIAASIKEFGFCNPILLDGENGIIAGHGRVDAAKKLKLKTVPTIELSHLSDIQKKAYILADNRLSESGGTEWDIDLVSIELEALDMQGFDIDLTGFDDSWILEGEGGGLTDEDEVPEVPEDPITKTGDLWLLGDHRLLCGDSTKIEDVEMLMDGKKADMVFTDPPYNIDYGSTKNPRHKIRSIINDSMATDEWETFCKSLFVIFQEYVIGDIYMWGASAPEGMRMRIWLVETGCHWSATIIWKKQQLVLSPAKYQRMYEPCFYGWYDKSSFCADRKQVEVWEIDRPLNSKLHPTMKPVELCEEGVQNSSKRKDIVMDLFGGSGSTLIACEKINRKCYMMELDEKYCDVIINRWQDYTGKEAAHSETGIKFNAC